MSMNSFGHLFRVTTWGESHGPAIGATVDGCPPGVPVDAEMIQHWLDKRKPGQNKYTTTSKTNFDPVMPTSLISRNTASATIEAADDLQRVKQHHGWPLAVWRAKQSKPLRQTSRSQAI